MTDEEIPASYWLERIEIDKKDFPILPYRKKPCSSCPVVDGMYKSFSESLSGMPRDIIETVSAKWFCHTNPNKACRGNANYVGIKC